MSGLRFDVRFDPDAAKEYEKLDNSIIETVDKAIDELQYRADEVGKQLGNKYNTKLAGCKEIKLRDAGIRIVFRIANEKVDILRVVYILTIEQRSKELVFYVADKRLSKLKNIPNREIEEFLKVSRKWNNDKK